MIKIVTDTSSLYSVKDGARKGIKVAPLSVTINGKTYREYEDINTKEFIDIINEGYVPISSQPSIGEVLDIYSEDLECDIINISMGDGLSGTYNSAWVAKDMDKRPERIEVIDSQTLCGAEKYLVDLSVELVNLGKEKDEVVKIINEILVDSKSFLIPNDFDYLVRGGRLSPLVGKIGSAIKLVPIMTLANDKKSLVKFGTKRTFKKAIQKICETMIEDKVDSNYKIYISHALREDLAKEAKNIILEYIDGGDIEINILGPVFTTHGGPGCIAVQYIKRF